MKFLAKTLGGILLIIPTLSQSDANIAGKHCQMKDSSLGPADRYDFVKCAPIAPTKSNVLQDGIGKILTSTICVGLKCVPSEQGAVNDLVNQVNPAIYKSTNDVAASNLGLRSFFKEKMQTKSCFGSLAFRFYGETSLHGSATNMLSSTKGNGKVWKTALKYAGGDESLALALIGACGHDNSAKSNEELKHVMCMDEIDKKIAAANGAKQCLGENKGIAFSCPQKNSAFFSQGGLTDVEIPSDLKTELAKNYAPNSSPDKTLTQLPLKYYHVYGAAYLTCQMIENGVSKEKATEAEKITALLYRAVRVCSNSNTNVENYKRILLNMKESGISIPEGEIFTNPQKWNEVSEKMILFLSKKLQTDETSILTETGLIPTDTAIYSNPDDRAAVLEKIKNYPGIVLAGYLTMSQHHNISQNELLDKLKTTYGNGAVIFNDFVKSLQTQTESPLLRLGSSALKSLGYENMGSFSKIAPCLSNSLINFAAGYKYQCIEYSDCKNAQEKLGTYVADYLQTKKYHEFGGDFAARHCNQRPSEQGSFENAACIALDKIRRQNSESMPQDEISDKRATAK